LHTKRALSVMSSSISLHARKGVETLQWQIVSFPYPIPSFLEIGALKNPPRRHGDLGAL